MYILSARQTTDRRCPIASRYWRGTNTTATDTANWSATRYGVTGASVPGSSDDAYFIDSATDVATVTAFAPATITVGGNYQGGFQGMFLSTAACIVTIEDVAFGKNIVIGPDAATTLASVHVRSTGKGRVTIVAGAAGVLTLLQVGKVGTLFVDGSCPVTTYNNCGMNDTFAYSATAITTGQWSGGGTHDVQRAVTTATVDGIGTRVNITATGSSPTSTTLTVSSGGTWAHDSDGTITTANVKPGGTLAPVSTKFTVTTMNLWEGGNGNRSSDKISVGTLNPIGNPS